MKDVQTLPFDQYQRYRLVADLLGELRAAGEPLEVLDVGGRTALLREFMTQDRITLVDVEESEEQGLILGDGARLPFKDGAFDVVCAFDTLEHVPVPLREAFVSECRRVTRGWVVLAGPYASAKVARAEKLLGRFMKEKLGIVHRYLQEHADHGLPVRKAVETQLASLGAEVKSFGHANLDRWLVLMCLSMYMDDDPALRKLATSFHRFYNRALYASDHATPVYRHLVVAAFDGAAMPDAQKHLAPPQAPKGSLEPFEGLATELLAFDKERGEWRLERDRLRQVVEDLRQDLAGSKLSIGDLERDLAAARADGKQARGQAAVVRATLEQDLAGHRRTVDNLERELAETRAGVELDKAEERRVRDSLEADLADHRKSIAAALGELEVARSESEAQRTSLESDLAEHRKSLADLGRELDAAREALAASQEQSSAQRLALEADLAAHGLSIADLQRELESTREQARATQADSEAQRATLEADLVEHKRVVAALERDVAVAREEGEATRAALQGVIDEKDRGIAALEGEVRRVEGVASSLNADLDRALRDLSELGGVLEQRTAEIAELRAELGDRWHNFLRAISLGKSQS